MWPLSFLTSKHVVMQLQAHINSGAFNGNNNPATKHANTLQAVSQTMCYHTLPTMEKKLYCLRQYISKRGRQSANQSVSQASRQSDRNTQFRFFSSGRLGFKQLGEQLLQNAQRSSGKVANRRRVRRRFEPQSADRDAGADGGHAGNQTADLQACSRLHYHWTAAYADSTGSPHCLKPSEHKLLTPPPTPQKSVIQFQGIEAAESKKYIGALSYWAK